MRSRDEAGHASRRRTEKWMETRRGCHCGDVYDNHARVKAVENLGSLEDVRDAIVHKDLQAYINSNDNAAMPRIEWTPERAFQTSPTDCYGKINFKDGDKKPAKYIRVGINDDVKKVHEFLTNQWKIMSPRNPQLVINVTGGAKNFSLSNKNMKRLHDATIKIAHSTSAWLVTSGFSVGLMKLVGEAVLNGQTFSFDAATGRAMHNVKCIGIGPWGNVLNSDVLQGTHPHNSSSPDQVFRTVYKKAKVSPEAYDPMPLDSNVTHFVLVDNGYRNSYTGSGSVASFVTAFLSELKSNDKRPISLVTLVVNGGKSVFEDIQHSITRKIPVVICEGTERAADVFADAYWHSDKDGNLSEEYIKRLDEKIESIESNWSDQAEKQRSREVVEKCCRNKHLITIFDMRRNQNLDDCFLQAVIKGQKDSWPRYYHFNLAFACNNADFAERELLKQTINFNHDYLVAKLTEAIVENKCGFVKLILKQDIDLTAYLTRKRLTSLYNKTMQSSGSDHLCRMLGRTCSKNKSRAKSKEKNVTLGDIGRVLDRLVYRYDKTVYCDRNIKGQDVTDAQPSKNPDTNSDTIQMGEPNRKTTVDKILLRLEERQETIQSRYAWQSLVPGIDQDNNLNETGDTKITTVLQEAGGEHDTTRIDSGHSSSLNLPDSENIFGVLPSSSRHSSSPSLALPEQSQSNLPRDHSVRNLLTDVDAHFVEDNPNVPANAHQLTSKSEEKVKSDEHQTSPRTGGDDVVDSEMSAKTQNVPFFKNLSQLSKVKRKTVNEQLTFADRELFIWAILNNRVEMAKYFWEYSVQPISTALFGAWLCKKILNECSDADTGIVCGYTTLNEYFETAAKESLDAMADKYPEKALELLEQRVARWNNLTCMQLASAGESRDFVAGKTSQTFIKNKWKGGITTPNFYVFLCNLLPLFMFVKFDKDRVNTTVGKCCGSYEKVCTKCHMYFVNRFCWFYSSPMVKYIQYTLTYVIFLLLFTYMVLFKVERTINTIQCAVFLWVVSYIADELHRLIVFPIPSIRWKLIDNEGYTSILYMFNSIMMVVAFLIHAYSDNYNIIRIIYCINLIGFYIRLLRAYTPSEYLGPKLYIIKEALKQLMLFFVILFVFLIAYGVASYATLYPKLETTWPKISEALRHIFLVPYWHVYGELMLDDLTDDEACYKAYNISADAIDPSLVLPCRTSSTFLPIILAVYLFVGNILLINLIIAIFSRIFTEIEDNSKQVWRFQMYSYTIEYDVKSYLPPPLNLLEYVVRFARYIYRVRKGCLNPNSKDASDSTREREVLRWLEEETNRQYLRKLRDSDETCSSNVLQDMSERINDLMTAMRDIEKVQVQKGGGINKEELQRAMDEFGSPAVEMTDDHLQYDTVDCGVKVTARRKRLEIINSHEGESDRMRGSSTSSSRRASSIQSVSSKSNKPSNSAKGAISGWFRKVKKAMTIKKRRRKNKSGDSSDSEAVNISLGRMDSNNDSDEYNDGL